ncbi:RND transporter [Geomonas silvestris]|uniref:RND transporter n=1 Tax=Geomonas silvestris TaxID=2740184 RepID=A0A6V8MI99_9BACT|nr:TolC family protein [Geomonas silvestris]GFO59389.1 RND transporter [Geomonas silvestris]
MVRHALLAGLLCSALLSGEAQGATYSFEQLMSAASASYPTILSKESAREAAAADVKSAEWQRFPAPSIETNTDREGNNNVVFRLQQVLWAGGSITGGIQAARAQYDASDKAIREAQYDVVSQLIEAYVDAVRQQERREISRQNLKQHELLDETIKRRVASEISPEVDHQLSLSRLSQAMNDLSVINQALTRSLTTLSQLSGHQVSETVPVDLAALTVPGSRDAAVHDAVAVSPSLARLGFEERAAEAEVTVKKAVLWPQVALRYEKSFNNNAGIYGATSDNRIMAVVQAQPGAGLSAFTGVASAEARTRAARQEREATLRDLERIIANAWNDREAARTQLEFANRARTSAQDVAESYKRQYIIGRKAWLDVLNAVREATQSELSVADARAQLAVTSLKLALYTDNLRLEVKK